MQTEVMTAGYATGQLIGIPLYHDQLNQLKNYECAFHGGPGYFA